MNIRKLSSVALFISAIVVTVTGLTLYFHWGPRPPSIVGHEIFSITFILALFAHIVLNFKTFTSYLGKIKKPSKEFVVNGIITIVFAVIMITATVKAPAVSNSAYPVVENIPLKAVLESEGIDYDKAMTALSAAGMQAPENVTLRELAKANKANPKLIYGILSSVK